MMTPEDSRNEEIHWNVHVNASISPSSEEKGCGHMAVRAHFKCILPIRQRMSAHSGGMEGLTVGFSKHRHTNGDVGDRDTYTHLASAADREINARETTTKEK